MLLETSRVLPVPRFAFIRTAIVCWLTGFIDVNDLDSCWVAVTQNVQAFVLISFPSPHYSKPLTALLSPLCTYRSHFPSEQIKRSCVRKEILTLIDALLCKKDDPKHKITSNKESHVTRRATYRTFPSSPNVL